MFRRKVPLFCLVKDAFQISEAERHATHDALGCVACQEYSVGLFSQAYQQEQFCLSEVLSLINVSLEKCNISIIMIIVIRIFII